MGAVEARRACGAKTKVSVEARPKASEANFSSPNTCEIAECAYEYYCGHGDEVHWWVGVFGGVDGRVCLYNDL